ncbi:hypothetical protein EVA_19124, partial [gut metagenome]
SYISLGNHFPELDIDLGYSPP